jgi:hypothetical protein
MAVGATASTFLIINVSYQTFMDMALDEKIYASTLWID